MRRTGRRRRRLDPMLRFFICLVQSSLRFGGKKKKTKKPKLAPPSRTLAVKRLRLELLKEVQPPVFGGAGGPPREHSPNQRGCRHCVEELGYSLFLLHHVSVSPPLSSAAAAAAILSGGDPRPLNTQPAPTRLPY